MMVPRVPLVTPARWLLRRHMMSSPAAKSSPPLRRVVPVSSPALRRLARARWLSSLTSALRWAIMIPSVPCSLRATHQSLTSSSLASSVVSAVWMRPWAR